MNKSVAASISIVLIISTCAFSQSVSQKTGFDLLIRRGTVVDGTGRKGFAADVGVLSGKIVFVGRAGKTPTRDVIDASGLVVAPGFIDVHSHTATAIAKSEQRHNECEIRQGVTTVLGGPDGELAPEQIRSLIEAYQKNGIGTNVAFYIGHNGVRVSAMGRDRRLAAPDEITKMRALVREGMKMGAVGLSTGLMYEPGMFSDKAEVIALAREVAPFRGTYDSHVREPVKALLESDREAIETGRAAGIPVKIAHEKAVGLENAGKIKDVIQMVEKARKAGLEVVTDQYPYDGAATGSLQGIIVIPQDMRGGGFDLKAVLNDPEKRQRLKESTENGIGGGFSWIKAVGYSSLRITSSRDYPDLVGKYPCELAKERRMGDFDLVCELVLGAKNPVGITLGAIQEDDLRALLVQKWNMIGTDGFYVDSNSGSGGHPRSTGTFPRILGRYVRELKLLSLEEAVRKMTRFPAEHLGLKDRGRISKGFAADITIFDPQKVTDRSTWDQPNLMAQGISHVIVNGIPVLRDGTLTGQAPGRYIPRQR